MVTELFKHQKYEKVSQREQNEKVPTNLNLNKKKGFKALKHINTQYLAHFVNRCCFETYICFSMSFKKISKNKCAKKCILIFINASPLGLKFFLPFHFVIIDLPFYSRVKRLGILTINSNNEFRVQTSRRTQNFYFFNWAQE